MKRVVIGLIAAGLLFAPARTATAQSKTVAQETKVETATVETIDATTRMITLKKADGTFVTTVAGPDVKRFAEIKVGDTVTARYLENLVVRVKQPGESEQVSAKRATTPTEGALPGASTGRQVTITATISDINMDVPSVTFTGPDGRRYISKVQDKDALAKVKVGDKVDIIWTQAVLLSLERGK